MLLRDSNIEVDQTAYNNLNRSRYSIFTGDLLSLLFGNTTLAVSSLTGTESHATHTNHHKQPLDTPTVNAIVSEWINLAYLTQNIFFFLPYQFILEFGV